MSGRHRLSPKVFRLPDARGRECPVRYSAGSQYYERSSVKILVYGGHSQLGRELVSLLKDRQIEHATLTTDEVDVLKPKDVVKAVTRINPTQLINVATYTNLQKAESDTEAARLCDLVNTEGVTSLARVCEQLGIPMLHHSSSYVF
ncbi:MAG: sugar nucleotide-binding protein, partial [Rhodothermales bacterium]